MGKYDANTGASITQTDADKKAKKWKDNSSKKVDTNACFFGKDWVQMLLDKPNCTGIWVNFGESDNGKQMEPYLVAGNVNGGIINNDSADEVENATYVGDPTKCPPDCP